MMKFERILKTQKEVRSFKSKEYRGLISIHAEEALQECIDKYDLKIYVDTSKDLKAYLISDVNCFDLIRMIETINRNQVIICPVEDVERITPINNLTQGYIAVPV